jgi:hypothetical protein
MAAHASALRNPGTQRNSRAQHNSRTRALRVATCSLCGLERPIGLMVPDGGAACADLRWYCKDAQSCTERWTAPARLAPARPAPAKVAAEQHA